MGLGSTLRGAVLPFLGAPGPGAVVASVHSAAFGARQRFARMLVALLQDRRIHQ